MQTQNMHIFVSGASVCLKPNNLPGSSSEEYVRTCIENIRKLFSGQIYLNIDTDLSDLAVKLRAVLSDVTVNSTEYQLVLDESKSDLDIRLNCSPAGTFERPFGFSVIVPPTHLGNRQEVESLLQTMKAQPNLAEAIIAALEYAIRIPAQSGAFIDDHIAKAG